MTRKNLITTIAIISVLSQGLLDAAPAHAERAPGGQSLTAQIDGLTSGRPAPTPTRDQFSGNGGFGTTQ